MGIAPSQPQDDSSNGPLPPPRPSLGPRPHNAHSVPFSTLRPNSRFMRSVEYLRPVRLGRRVENIFIVQRQNIRLVPCDSNPSVYVVEFEFKAHVPGSLAVYLRAQEHLQQTRIGDESVVTGVSYAARGRPPSTFSFDIGDNQVFRQRQEDGLDLRQCSERELKYSQDAVYPLVIKLDASPQPQQRTDNQPNVKSHITLAQIVLVDGQPTVRVIEQKVFIGTAIFSMDDMYGIQASYDASHAPQTDAHQDSTAECVVCLTEPSTTAVQPCKHLCLCDDCARILTLEVEAQLKCPVCRSPIGKLLRILDPNRENLETDDQRPRNGSFPAAGATTPTPSPVMPDWHPMQYTTMRPVQAPFETNVRGRAPPVPTNIAHPRNPLHTPERGSTANLSEGATHPLGRLHLE